MSNNAAALRQLIITLGEAFRQTLYKNLAQLPYCALTMDGGQIHSRKLFITNILSRIPRLSCTNSIETVDEMNHETLSEIVVNILNELHAKEITVSTITCDGASYQVKALNFEDPSSIQKRNHDTEHLRKLVFIPCLCHRSHLFAISEFCAGNLTNAENLGLYAQNSSRQDGFTINESSISSLNTRIPSPDLRKFPFMLSFVNARN
jgi:hypothetical protein